MDIRELRDELARELTEQVAVDAAWNEAKAAWEAEMKPLIERRAEIQARVKALDEAAREAIREAVEAGGTEAIDGVVGFAAARVRTVHYDEDELLRFAQKHEPALIKTSLVNQTAIKNWLAGQAEATDFETGEKVHVLVEDFGQVTIPVREEWTVQPRISDTALLALEDEKRWNEAREQ